MKFYLKGYQNYQKTKSRVQKRPNLEPYLKVFKFDEDMFGGKGMVGLLEYLFFVKLFSCYSIRWKIIREFIGTKLSGICGNVRKVEKIEFGWGPPKKTEVL